MGRILDMYACLDIGGTSIKVGISDKNGNLTNKGNLKISDEFSVIIDGIVNWIEEIRKSYDIEGIAISAPGAVNSKTGVIGGASALPCIHGPNWKEVLCEKTGLPISIENDANCAALAESFSGKGKDLNDILFVVCGTEESNGEYLNFSEVASTMSFVRKVRKHYNDDSWNGESIFEAAEKGDEVCRGAIDTFYKNLAKGIFNLQHIYDPEIILLGGAISNREDFIDRINEKLLIIREKINIDTLMPNIDTCTHKKDANLVGALANFLMEHGE
ncbi:MAG: ROK family protein [Clostridium sp.]|nr:ROK family protein [Clostridium sp.]